MDKLGLTGSHRQQIEKVIIDRVPIGKAEEKGTWCSSEKMTIARLRKRVLDELLKEKVEQV